MDAKALARLNRCTDVVDTVPQLARGRVWCHECGHTEPVNSRECLRSGWPKCCGYTMSIDSPAERGRA
jgi:hypothetical protein